jgi:hypothetical protein
MLQYGPRGNLLGAVTVATAFLGGVLDVFVHALLFFAYATYRFFFLFPWHKCTSFSILTFRYQLTPI